MLGACVCSNSNPKPNPDHPQPPTSILTLNVCSVPLCHLDIRPSSSSGLSERLQRFMTLEVDYSIKSALVHTTMAASSLPPNLSSAEPWNTSYLQATPHNSLKLTQPSPTLTSYPIHRAPLL